MKPLSTAADIFLFLYIIYEPVILSTAKIYAHLIEKSAPQYRIGERHPPWKLRY